MGTEPEFPVPSHELSLEGIRIGHASDLEALTGATVILCPEGLLGAAEVRGTATGTRQFDSLVLGHHVASRAHAVVLAGGSGFGLSAADPVVEWLEERGYGFQTGIRPVPLVPTAILFDLAMGDPSVSPSAEMVREALAGAAAGPVAAGSVGAGTGASVGKANGLDCGMKGGFGFASLTVPGGPTVAAAVAVNAFGDVRDPATDRIVAGCRTAPDAHTILGADRVLANLPPEGTHPWEGNTTLAVVMTDAQLEKAALMKVCQMSYGGFHRTLVPALSMFDGDLVLTLTTGQKPAHVNQIGLLAERAVEAAILRAVREADGFGVLPAVRDLSG